MAYPDKPTIATSYTDKEHAVADGSLPGQELDVDFAALKSSLEALNDFVRGVTRSDGLLANGIVRRESLGADVLIGFDAPTTWVTGSDYALSNTVFNGAAFYICLLAHTAGSSFSADLVAGRWSLLFDLSGTGTLVSQNNLSDLDSAPDALANLELTATAAELNALDGISGDVQSQIDALTSAVGGKQAASAVLTLLSGLTLAANKGLYATGSDALATYDLSVTGRELTGVADKPAARTYLDVAADSADADLSNASVASARRGIVKTYVDGGNAGPVAASGSNTVELSSVPSGTTEIILEPGRLSLNGTDNVLIQLSTSGTYATTGYAATQTDFGGGSVSTSSSTSGFLILVGIASAELVGPLRLQKEPGSNRWSISGTVRRDTIRTNILAGDITLAGELDGVRFVTSGANNFDGGAPYLVSKKRAS